MNSLEESASSTLLNLTYGICINANTRFDNTFAFACHSFTNGVNFLEQQTLNFSD